MGAQKRTGKEKEENIRTNAIFLFKCWTLEGRDLQKQVLCCISYCINTANRYCIILQQLVIVPHRL